MPKLSVWMVRAALIHMGTGFLFGSLILYHKGIPLFDWTWKLLNPHVEIMVFGWTMQFVMGIAFWILPRFSSEPRYGKTGWGWWSFGLLNSGILLTATGAWFNHAVISLAGHTELLGAVLLFIVLMYPRVRPFGYAASPAA